jgi:hypothetical protein
MPEEPIERRRGGRRMTDGVNVSTADMYALLLKIDRNLSTLTTTVGTQATTIIDHEARLRHIEAAADNGLRVTAMEDDVKAIRDDLEAMKRKVYAIPSAAAAIAAGALILTLVRTF